MEKNRLNININLTYFFSLIILLFLFHSFFYKTFKIPLLILSIDFLVFSFICYSVSNNIFISKDCFNFLKLYLLFTGLLIFSILIGIHYPDIPTSSYTDPIIPAYKNTIQIFKGFIYNNTLFIYLLLFTLFFSTQKNKIKKLKKAHKVIYYFIFINIIINFFEFFIPPLHSKLMSIAGYKVGYFFVSRPVGIFLNSYVNAFFCAFFSFWSINYFYQFKQKKYLILFLIGFISTILCGARFAILLLFLSTIIFLILTRKKLVMLLILLIFLGIVLILYFTYKPYWELFYSIFTISDPSGSANVHKQLFIASLKVFFKYPWGVGIGKTDFGALNTIPQLAYDPESYLLSLLLGGGIITFLVYITIHIFLLRKLLKNKLFQNFSFNLAVLIVSICNIQILQSFICTFLIALLYIPSLVKIKNA